jgi:hypothetical protein
VENAGILGSAEIEQLSILERAFWVEPFGLGILDRWFRFGDLGLGYYGLSNVGLGTLDF